MNRKQRYRMCERKTAYSKSKTAHRAATRIGLRAYECPICARWHLTSIGAKP